MDMAMINAVMQTPNMQMDGMQDMLGTDAGMQGLFAMLFGQMLSEADAEGLAGLAEDPMLGTLFSSVKDETDGTQLRLAMEMMAGTLVNPQALELLLGQTDNAAPNGIAQTVQTVQTALAAQTMRAARTVQTVQDAQTMRTAQTVQDAQTMWTAQTAQDAQAMRTAQDAQAMRTAQDAQTMQTVQTVQTRSLLLEQLQAQLELAEQQAQVQADSKVHDTDWDTLLDTLTTAWEAETGGDGEKSTVFTHELDQAQFASAVRQVRELLAEKTRGAAKEETRQPLDVEALQAAADSRQYVPDTVSARQETPDLKEITDQLKTGILDNLRQGKNEFVVKLKPEGLGEITVKLTESKNEISLRIVTSSAAVGRMIANDVNTLQNALRPLRAQVQEIVTVPAAGENAAGTMLTGGQGEQQFAWHYQNQNRQQTGGGRAHADDGGEFEDLVEEVVPDDANVNVLI